MHVSWAEELRLPTVSTADCRGLGKYGRRSESQRIVGESREIS